MAVFMYLPCITFPSRPWVSLRINISIPTSSHCIISLIYETRTVQMIQLFSTVWNLEEKVPSAGASACMSHRRPTSLTLLDIFKDADHQGWEALLQAERSCRTSDDVQPRCTARHSVIFSRSDSEW